MGDRFTSLEDILKIDPMKSYYSEQLKLNEDALEYMQVYDRTTNSLVDRNLWEYEIDCNYKCHKISWNIL